MERIIEKNSLAIISKLPQICKPNEFMVAYFIINSMAIEKSDRIKLYRSQLADLCNMSERNISRITESLNQLGIITKDLVGDAEKKKTYNYYRLNWSKIDEFFAESGNEEGTFLPELSGLKNERIEEVKKERIKEIKEECNTFEKNENIELVCKSTLEEETETKLDEVGVSDKVEKTFDEEAQSLEKPISTTITTTITTTTSNTTTNSTSIESTNDYFNDFKEKVDEELVGNEDELLQRKVKLSTELSKKRIAVGNTVYNRCSSYLRKKYEEKCVC
jgi:DNA-binding transcriptional ArsR family regulator